MMLRGPGGTEPTMIIERVKAGKTFDEAVAEVEVIGQFRCEQWWKDLNHAVITDEHAPKPPAVEAAAPKQPEFPKGKR